MILRNCSRTLLSLSLLLVTLTSSPGCRSTSRWNPTSWFASREPDASMIAGRNGDSELPTSPAINQTPTALANNYGATGSGNKSGLQSGLASGSSGTSQGYGSQSYGSQSANGTLPQSAGLAARSNGFSSNPSQATGYQTGPYGMSPTASGSNLSTPAVAASTSNVAAPANASPTNPTAFPSPYGGSYGATPAQGPAGTASTFAASPGIPPTSLPAVPASSSASWNVPEYPSLPAMQVSAPLGNSSGTAGLPTNTSVPASSAYQSAPTSGSYSPGTTGRNTNYNFGAGSSYQGSGPSSSSLPPNTATGNSQWVR